ncbi:hypothetical protein I317_05773 [Kwoniella heveanensis CBS 569]|nr:hypothetical protein I317_05773 [Kwoniella heveanensis CBS 569]
MRSLGPVERQWIFSPSALNNAPSRDDGITLEEELRRRAQTINYMRSLALRANSIGKGQDPEAIHLRGTLVVGATLVHRFYMRRSLKDFSEKLIAATILFLAAKIEEEPLKLRHIVNVSIQKFEPPMTRGWEPDRNPNDQPSLEYRRWEKDILSLEEIVLEATCFDMAIEQPWVILRRATKGLDQLIGSSSSAGSDSHLSSDVEASSSRNGHAVGHLPASHVNGSGNGVGNGRRDTGKGKGKMTESVVVELGWTILSESALSPLAILYPASIIAFAAFILLVAIIEQIPLSQGRSAAAELADKFGLDVFYSEEETGPTGADLVLVNDCLSRWIEYMNDGLIDKGISAYIFPEPEPAESLNATRYQRRFSSTIHTALTTTAATAVPDGKEEEEAPDTHSSAGQREATKGAMEGDADAIALGDEIEEQEGDGDIKMEGATATAVTS